MPAGLVDAVDKSAPNAPNAFPIAILRAVPV